LIAGISPAIFIPSTRIAWPTCSPGSILLLIPNARGRDERLELPEDALREALVNAIAHRHYRSTANVQVHIQSGYSR
jgi:hypothetical protein